MSDITVTAANVAAMYPAQAEIYDRVAAVAVTAGQVLYLNSSGKVDLYDSNGSGTLQPEGIALNSAGAGQGVSVLKRGFVNGFTISSLAYNAALYGSNTAGALADAAGSSSVILGRVKAVSDSSVTKALYIDMPWLTILS